MKQYTFRAAIVFLVVILIGYLLMFLCKEPFTSPGTMVQLASSHVPTQEDVDYYRNIYPKVVRHDLIDMTGNF